MSDDQLQTFGALFPKLLEKYRKDIYETGIEVRIEALDKDVLYVSVAKVMEKITALAEFQVLPDGTMEEIPED
jgi:hypothetical protein